MKVFLIVIFVFIAGVLIEIGCEKAALEKEKYVAQRMSDILKRNKMRFKSYSILARQFVQNNQFLMNYDSFLNFSQIRIKECKKMRVRLSILKKIIRSERINTVSRWHNLESKKQYIKTRTANQKLVEMAIELSVSTTKMLAYLELQPVKENDTKKSRFFLAKFKKEENKCY